jgi:hypothetical protein
MRQNPNYAIRLQDISEALIACGYTKLDKQAKALGVRRSTAWTIVKVKHKLGPHEPHSRKSRTSRYRRVDVRFGSKADMTFRCVYLQSRH